MDKPICGPYQLRAAMFGPVRVRLPTLSQHLAGVVKRGAQSHTGLSCLPTMVTCTTWTSMPFSQDWLSWHIPHEDCVCGLQLRHSTGSPVALPSLRTVMICVQHLIWHC
jgi:hypothetical protein